MAWYFLIFLSSLTHILYPSAVFDLPRSTVEGDCMRSLSRVRAIYRISVSAILLSSLAWGQPEYEQTLELVPGWNAVYLEVQPEPSDPETLFQGLPIESVWTYVPRTSSVDFISNPSAGLWNVPNWLVYVPSGRPEAVTTNLYKMGVNRCYIINIAGTQTVSWTVSGRPSLRKMRWVSNSLNFVGFPIDPDAPPRFRDFFSPSEAHSGQSIYRLNPDGTWETVPDTALMRSGEAYWVYCNGDSSYSGPLEIDTQAVDGFDFDTALKEKQLFIKNLSDSASISLKQQPGPNPVILSYWDFDEEAKTVVWPELPSTHQVSAPQGEQISIRLGVRRAEFDQDSVESVLEIRNDAGARYLLPVVAKVYRPPGYHSTMSRAETLAGLWLGTVYITGVSESQTGSLVPTPVEDAFFYRIIVHVDANGAARLLKHVVLMVSESTYRLVDGTPAPSQPPRYELEEPGQPVLLTDESLIPNFKGVKLLDSGDLVGQRVSTIAYDFEGFQLDMDGNFGEIGDATAPYALTCNLVLGREHPTNPFLHRYHPDHNNLDPFYLPYDMDPSTGEPVKEESFKVTRTMEFGFTDEPPVGPTPLDWGSSIVGGIFRETLSGLHKNRIVVEGNFQVERVSTATELNPEVAP